MIVSSTHVRLILAAAVFTVAASACSDETPTSPDTNTPPTAGGPPPPSNNPPTTSPAGAISIQINPNPVPHSGARIADAPGCANVQFTWFYDQVIRETGGSTVTLTNRIDLFDEVLGAAGQVAEPAGEAFARLRRAAERRGSEERGAAPLPLRQLFHQSFAGMIERDHLDGARQGVRRIDTEARFGGARHAGGFGLHRRLLTQWRALCRSAPPAPLSRRP